MPCISDQENIIKQEGFSHKKVWSICFSFLAPLKNETKPNAARWEVHYALCIINNMHSIKVSV